MVRATFDVPHALRRIVAQRAAAWLACALAGALWTAPVLAQDAGGPIVIPGPGQQNSPDLARMTEMATSGSHGGARPVNAPALSTLAPTKPASTDRFSTLANSSGSIVIPGTGEPATPATPHRISTAPNTPPAATGLTRVNMNAGLAASQVMPVVVNAMTQRAANAAAEPSADVAQANAVEIDSLAARGEPPELGASAVSRNPSARGAAVVAPAQVSMQVSAPVAPSNPVLARLSAPSQAAPQALAEAAQRAQAIEAAMGQSQGGRGFSAAAAQAATTLRSAQMGQTGRAVQPVQTAQLAQPARYATPAQPAQTAQPVQYARPVQAAQPVQPAQYAQYARPVQPAQPVQPVQYAQPAQAAQPVPAGQEDGELIHAAALDFLKQQIAGLPGHVDVTVFQAFPRGLAACATLQPFLPNGARLWGRTTVGVRCTSGHPWTVWLQAKVSINATYYVAARAMNPGEVITEADLVGRDGDLTMLPMSIVTSPSQAVGSVTLMRVGQGLPLRQDMLKNAQQVTAGQTVQVVAEGDGFQISSEGSALANAQPGQPVKVKTATGQIVMGIVKNSSTVQIQM